MKKLRKRLGLNPTLSIVIIMVSVLVMAGVVFGIAGLSELLTVRADNTATVSPTDGDGEEVSGSDATNPKRRNITGSISPRIFNDDGDPEGDPTEDDTGKEIPFTMTHLITMNDGSTISSAVPSTEGDPTGRIWNYNDSGEVNHQTVHQNQPTMTGTLYYGYNFGMYFSSYVAQRTTFIGSVKVNLNDGRTIDWNVGSTWSDYYDREHSYAFNWSSVQPQLDAFGKGYDDIDSIDINIVFGTPHPLLLTVQRHNSEDVVKISPRENVLYNRIFDSSLYNKYKGSGGTGCMRVDDAKTGVASAQFAEGVTDTTFAKSVSSRGFYWVDLANEGRTIQQIRARDVNGSDITSSCVFQDESGRFYFKMSNGYNCIMDVITAPSDVYKIKVEATSSDFSMNCIELSDSSNDSAFYTSSITTIHNLVK